MPLIITPRQLTQRAQFYQQFGQLLAAGVSVLNALELIAKNPPNASFRAPIQQLAGRIQQGDTFTGAVRSLGRWLPEFDLALIEAGEHSGRLDAVCRLLANYCEDRARILLQMLADVAYPAFALHVAIFVFPFITLVRPGGTWTMFCLQTFGVLFLIYGLAFFFIFAAQGRHGLKWRSWLERVLRNVPVLGKARQALALSRLAVSLEALINAGVTIIEGWMMASSASGSPAIERAVHSWKPDLMAGKTPSDMVRASPLFPEMFSNFYHTGEVSGQLDDSLKRLHQYYHEEGSRKMHILGQWVPRIIYFGVLIYGGIMVIRSYLHIWDDIWKMF